MNDDLSFYVGNLTHDQIIQVKCFIKRMKIIERFFYTHVLSTLDS